MSKFDSNTYVMAERLKELRKSRGLSHAGLSETLRKEYDIKISKDVLIAYEAPQHHAREGANNGMSARYLRCLADFYGVSADYLLGLTDEATPNMDERAAIEYTGLKEETLKKWQAYYYPATEFKDYYTYSPIDFVNEFLFDDYTLGIVTDICSSISEIQKSAAYPSLLELNTSTLDELEEIDDRLEKYGLTTFSISKFNFNRAIAAAVDLHSSLNELINKVYNMATEQDSKLWEETLEAARKRIKMEARNGIDET